MLFDHSTHYNHSVQNLKMTRHLRSKKQMINTSIWAQDEFRMDMLYTVLWNALPESILTTKDDLFSANWLFEADNWPRNPTAGLGSLAWISRLQGTHVYHYSSKSKTKIKGVTIFISPTHRKGLLQLVRLDICYNTEQYQTNSTLHFLYQGSHRQVLKNFNDVSMIFRDPNPEFPWWF